MLRLNICLAFSIILLSCNKSKKDSAQVNSLGGIVYEAQVRSLDKTISHYAKVSSDGGYYLQENFYLDSITTDLKNKINKGENIPGETKSAFFEHFEKVFSFDRLIDFDILRGLSLKTVSDLNILKLYIKNNLVCLLLNKRPNPYNVWSTMASTDKSEIKEGEEFEVSLANTMWNTTSPGEWFLIKDDGKELSKENISDTLHPNEFGVITFKTKKYNKGENVLSFASKMPDRRSGGNTLYRSVIFTVK